MLKGWHPSSPIAQYAAAATCQIITARDRRMGASLASSFLQVSCYTISFEACRVLPRVMCSCTSQGKQCSRPKICR